jgi:hypothetical protein
MRLRLYYIIKYGVHVSLKMDFITSMANSIIVYCSENVVAISFPGSYS